LKKKGKILISLLVILVVTSNISYAVTVSICGMSLKSSCACDVSNCACDISNDSETKDVAFSKEPCCKEQVKDISNTSDFLSRDKQDYNFSSLVTSNPDFCLYQNKCFVNNISFRLIFYESQTDLPVKYSSLLI